MTPNGDKTKFDEQPGEDDNASKDFDGGILPEIISNARDRQPSFYRAVERYESKEKWTTYVIR